jgi:hypothetical protein
MCNAQPSTAKCTSSSKKQEARSFEEQGALNGNSTKGIAQKTQHQRQEHRSSIALNAGTQDALFQLSSFRFFRFKLQGAPARPRPQAPKK